jgi:hypothetical protein
MMISKNSTNMSNRIRGENEPWTSTGASPCLPVV